MIEVEVIEDSVNPVGIRLTTLKLEYPRYIHPQLLTHRVFSRNSSSSRAIPTKTLIRRVRRNPVTPTEWRYYQRGMQPGDLMTESDRQYCETLWNHCLRTTLESVERMAEKEAAKELVNRLLEPFSHIQTLVTATDWQNFFTLRDHEDAQHEITVLARQMRDAMDDSEPVEVERGHWHLPFILDNERESLAIEDLVKISTARCARVSYYLHDGTSTTIEKDMGLYKLLVESKPIHASPSEHPAMALDSKDRVRNFRGWRQLRDFIDHESKVIP